MDFEIVNQKKDKEISDFFGSVFSESEGEVEGKLIGELAHELASGIDQQEIICISSSLQSEMVGCIFFTKLKFDFPFSAYLLAPVAVSTKRQKQGIGQALINYGLSYLREQSANIVLTYGDPDYYSKMGFQPLSEATFPAPHKLTMPFGWQGQSLTVDVIPTIKIRPVCVNAFNNTALW